MRREPVLAGAVAQIVVVVAAHFGLGWDESQVLPIVVGIMAAIALYQRSRVSPGV